MHPTAATLVSNSIRCAKAPSSARAIVALGLIAVTAKQVERARGVWCIEDGRVAEDARLPRAIAECARVLHPMGP